jgi:cell division protein FtsB
MSNFQSKKSDFRKLLESYPSCILLSILLVFFIFNIISLSKKMIEANNAKQIAENKMNELENRAEKLSLEIHNLETDKGKEELLREKFGLAKDGENMIVIVEDKSQKENMLKEKNTEDFFSFFGNLFK